MTLSYCYLGSSNGQIALWDSRFTSHPVHYLEGHTAGIYCGDWSPHCQSKIVSGGDDMKVIVWDLLKVETSEAMKSRLDKNKVLRRKKMDPLNCCSHIRVIQNGLMMLDGIHRRKE